MAAGPTQDGASPKPSPHSASNVQARYYPGGARSFFALFRFDFMLDERLTPWLIEVNQSPNLSSDATADLRNMFQRISFSLLNLMGFGLGQIRHPGNPGGHAEIIGHHNDIDIGWRVCGACTAADGGEATGAQGELEGCDGRCAICRRCRTPEQSRMLQVRAVLRVRTAAPPAPRRRDTLHTAPTLLLERECGTCSRAQVTLGVCA